MNFGKVILLGALFFGVRAVVKKDKTGSSGGGSDPGKTNDNGGTVDICEIVKKSPYLKKFVLSEDEMKKCESSVLNEERQKLLQSICKNINIAKENERLNGLSGADEEATKEEVESFLKAFNEKMRIFGIRFRDDRHKNVDYLIKSNLVPVKRISYIKKLTFDNFVKKQKDILNKGTDLWIFLKRIKNKNVYIKLTLGDVNNKVICISFHD